MYNPWSAHSHGHHHTHQHPHSHQHAHQHQHHGHPTHHTQHTPAPTVTSVSVPGTVSAASRLDLDSSPSNTHTQLPSQASYQMSQMRWLPSMITRSNNHSHGQNHGQGQGQGHNAALPNISSNLRLHSQQAQGQPHQQGQGQAPGVSGVVEGRTQGSGPSAGLVNPASVSVSQAQQQVQGQTQAVAISVESEESDRSESPGTRDMMGADTLGELEYGAGDGARNGGDGGMMDVEALAENGKVGGNGDAAGMNLTPRKHGKRLTTKEEVSLFEICNRHAADFGQRSNLCKWWMTVTLEFTRGQKHPYSWHSVRRKVELVTKQRMRFLEEQREKGASKADDLSNPRWRVVVDAWIPTWQRWEEAEARRIEKRDSRRPRKRKWTITTPTSTAITTDGTWDIPDSTPANDTWRASVASSSSNSPVVNPPTNTDYPRPISTPNPVRLPPGFDTLFSQSQSQSQSQPQQTPSSTSSPYTTNHQPNYHYNPSTPTTTSHANPTSTPNPNPADNTMMAAVLDTLGKLNKHFESSSTTTSPSTNPNPLPSTLTLTPGSQNPLSVSDPPSTTTSTQDSNANTTTSTTSASAIGDTESLTLSNLKESLRKEMMLDLRKEWDKERAVLEEKLDSVQRTQEMILEMLRQEPA